MKFLCNNIKNCNDKSYCPECSHGIFFGKGDDKHGKVWRWEFTSLFGPLFVDKKGEPLKRQPISSRHPAWKPFEAWHKGFQRYREHNRQSEKKGE